MGQYYFPVISRVRDTEIKGAEDIIMYLYSHEWNQGLKLMEHSYKGVDMVEFICSALADNPQHLTWSGDLIEVRKEPPTDDGWEEIVPQFKEEY